MTTESPAAWLERRILADETLTPELFAELRDDARRAGLVHGERPICTALQPFLLTRARYDRITRQAEILARAFERLAAAALADEEIMRELGLTEREERLARLDPGYATLCPTSRFDAFLAGDDFKFLEYNAENPSGLVDQELLENLLFDLPHMREFLARYPHSTPRAPARLLAALVEAYREWGGTEERPHIGIIDWQGVATESEFFILRDRFEREGYPTRVASPHDLSYDGRHLYAGDFRIDIFYKRVIIHEFLDVFAEEETHPLVQAYRDGRVCMVNSFRSKIAHKKACFAILSDERFDRIFTDEERATIAAHVPWTRRLRASRVRFENEERELIELITRARERFVIKPNDDYGGAGVVLGADVTADEWRARVDEATTKDYVVQERAPVERVRIATFDSDRVEFAERLVDFDPFMFANRAEGGIVRLSATSLSNVSAGAGVTALLVME